MVFFVVRSEEGKQNDGDPIDPQRSELGNQGGVGNNDLQQSDLCRFIDAGKENSRRDKTQQNTQIDVNGSFNGLFDNDSQ